MRKATGELEREMGKREKKEDTVQMRREREGGYEGEGREKGGRMKREGVYYKKEGRE